MLPAAMVNADQRDYFNAFGFIVLRKLFSRGEMNRIVAAWARAAWRPSWECRT